MSISSLQKVICITFIAILLIIPGCALQDAPAYEDELLQDDNLLALAEVVEALQSEGLNLTRSRARSPVELSLTEIKPFAYSVDDHPFNLFIYVYQSAIQRSDAYTGEWQGWSLLSSGYHAFHAKNTVLLFGPIDFEKINSAEMEGYGSILHAIRKAVDEQLNQREKYVFTGQSESWAGRAFVSQYRHRWETNGGGSYTESSMRVNKEIRYTGEGMDEIDRVRYSYLMGWGGTSEGSGQATLDAQGYLNIPASGGSGYLFYLEKGVPFSITLQWGDKEETMELYLDELLSQNYGDENDLLLLGNTMPFGLGYQDVKSRFPNLGPLEAEGGLQSLAEAGLMEAVLQTEILGHQAKLEFNFQQERLYGYYFFTTHADEDAATELYAYLQDFYRERYGPFAEEEQQEGENYIVSSHWQTGAHKFALTYQKNWDGRYFVNWGWCVPRFTCMTISVG